MKIFIDDTFYSIETDSHEINPKTASELNAILLEVLTPAQYIKYNGYDTARIFSIKKNKLDILLSYLK